MSTSNEAQTVVPITTIDDQRRAIRQDADRDRALLDDCVERAERWLKCLQQLRDEVSGERQWPVRALIEQPYWTYPLDDGLKYLRNQILDGPNDLMVQWAVLDEGIEEYELHVYYIHPKFEYVDWHFSY